jgi:molybdopterin synthase sulfur carrier subunit
MSAWDGSSKGRYIMVIARMSGQLRKFASGNDEVEIEAGDVKECINNLEKQFPGIESKLCNEKGLVLESINIYVNGDNIRFLKDLSTKLKEGDEVDFMSAFAAG